MYKKYAVIKDQGDKLIIDNRNMPDEAYEYELAGNLVLKVKLKKGEHVGNSLLDGNYIACYYEDQGYGFIYLPPLEKKRYTIEIEKGTAVQMPHVYNDGTYNVYDFVHNAGTGTEISVKIYGSQVLKIRNVTEYDPDHVSSSNPNLKIEEIKYSADNKELRLLIKAHDIEGERGIIRLPGIKYE